MTDQGLRAMAIVATVAFGLALFGSAGATAKPKPNLSISKVGSRPSAPLVAGESFRLSPTVRNRGRRGARKARVTVRLRRSGKVRRVGRRTIGRVKPGGRRSFRIRGRVPASYSGSSSPRLSVCVRRRGKRGKLRCRNPGRLPVAAPGRRSLGDPLLPQIGNRGYDALHYRINLDYDPEANAFNEGTSTAITAEATRNLSELSLDFQGLDVSEVTVDGIPARFEQVDAKPRLSENPEVTQPMKLVVTPTRATRPRAGREFGVEVAYRGEPQHITDADESIEGWIRACFPLDPPPPRRCDGSFVVNQPIGAQSWFPGNNYPTEKATFDTTITVPEEKVAFGVGELVARTQNGDGTTTWHWREVLPTAPYLTTGTVGDFDYVKLEMTERATGRTLPIYNGIDSSATKPQKDAVNESLDRAPGQLNFLSDLLGAYPFGSIGGVADRAAGVGYALEVQGKPHYAGGFETGDPSVNIDIQLHEIAHQWLGNSVSPATWQEIWFNEGWAEWFTWYWAYEENEAPNSPADQFEDNYTPGTKWNVAPAALGTPENLFASFPVYTRPAMMLEGYRQILDDDDRFFGFARELLDRFAYGNIGLEEFVEVALEMSGFRGQRLELLEAYFHQWLFRGGRPTIVPADFVGD